MDRRIVAPGEIPLVEDILSAYKNSMIDKAALAEAILGQSTQAYGLSATALSSGAVTNYAFAVQIGRGFIFAYEETDPNAYGVLGTDTTNILKTGINLNATDLGLTNTAPSTPGYSTNYLIAAAFEEIDTASTSLPFYNASNPLQPTYTVMNGLRQQVVVFEVVAGTPAATGSQTTPSAPAGYIPLWVVTINNGDSAVVAGQISAAPGAPFVVGLSALQSSINSLQSAVNTIDGELTTIDGEISSIDTQISGINTSLAGKAALGGSSGQSFQAASGTGSNNVVIRGDFPSALGGSSGWKKYPDPTSPSGYFIEQWAAGNTTAAGQTITFPIQFPNAVESIVICDGGSLPDAWGYHNVTTTGFSAYATAGGGSSGAASGAYSYRAKGY